MKILVTGGAGFIGSHLIDKLISLDHTVYSLDDYSGGNEKNHNDRAYYRRIDARDYEMVDAFIEVVQPEIVFHLAANAAENKAQFAPIDITSRNYDAFIKVLTASIKHKVKRFVYTSSNAVYGSITPPFHESDIPEPEDLYGLSKLMGEQTLKILSRVHNFEWVVARPHNIYGPRQSMIDPYRNVLMIWINKLLHGEPYTIYGDGSMSRCYTYVDDLIDGFYKLGFEAVNQEIFNLGSDEPISLKELSDMLQKVTGGILPPNYLPARPQEVTIAIPIHDKAKKILGYETKTKLEEGIRKTWEWAKKQGPQEVVYGGIEIVSSKMPANWK